MADNKRGGLTNSEALKVLIKKFDEFIEKIESFIPSKEKNQKFYRILDYIFLSYLLLIGFIYVIKIKVYPDPRDNDLTISITILILLVVYLSAFICEKVLKKTKIKENLLSLKEDILNCINFRRDKDNKIPELDEYEGNYYYGYDGCFVQILRNQEWVRMPKNVIVEGDYIKINIGEKSPADVRCVDYRYIPKDKKWDFCLKKDEIFKGFEESFNDSHLEFLTQNKYDKIFKSKDEWVFEVINDPFLEILELYVKNYESKSDSEKYDKFFKKTIFFKFIMLIIIVMVHILLMFYIIYNRDSSKTDFQENSLRAYFYFMTNPFTFYLIFIFVYFNFFKGFLIYWANAAMSILKEKIIKEESFFSILKANNEIHSNNFNIDPINKRHLTSENFFPNEMKRTNSQLNNIKLNSEKNPKIFYRNTYFGEFDFKDHIKKYFKFFREGIDKSYNLFSMSANLNRLCFLEKEGLIFQKEKEVCEIAFFKTNNNLEVLNVHPEEVKLQKENQYYTIEDYHQNKEEYESNLKPIALCSSVIKIPLENYKTSELIFLESNKIKNIKKILPISRLNKYSRIIKEKSGYLFSATHDELRQNFTDCLCLLTKSIGFSDKILNNYKNIRNIWHTNFIKYDAIDHENQKKIIQQNLDETEESIIYETNANIDLVSNENRGDIIISSILQDDLMNNLNYFTRGTPSGILNLCQDLWNGRSVEPLGGEIIQKVSSLMQQWQSSNIQPIAFSYKPTKKSIIDIIEKYNLDLDISDKSINHILKNNCLPQVFLGMVAMKNNLKTSFQDLMETLNDAGIIFVFFSKEDEKTTKKLADIVLCEYDFNQCISLKSIDLESRKSDEKLFVLNQNKESHPDNCKCPNQPGYQNIKTCDNIKCNTVPVDKEPSNNQEKISLNQIQMLNQEGNKYLPTGISEIRDFLEKKDEVPLQVNLFSDSTINNLQDMLEIYKEYNDVIGCLTSTLNTDNIPALAISDINFGINIKPSYICTNCNGKRCDFLLKNAPTLFENISMKINSIFCPFVIDEDSYYTSLSKIISSARFLNYRINIILKFLIHSIFYLTFLQLPSYIVMTRPLLDDYSLIVIIFFVFPLLVIGMLTIKQSLDHIKKLNASRRIKLKLAEHDSYFLKIFMKYLFIFLIIGTNIVVLNVIYFLKLKQFTSHLNDSIIIVEKSFLNKMTNVKNENITQPYLDYLNKFENSSDFLNFYSLNSENFSNLRYSNKSFFLNFYYIPYFMENYPKSLNRDYFYLSKNLTPINITQVVYSITTNFEHLNIIYFYIVIWFICCLSFLYVDKYLSIFSGFFFSNYKFLLITFIVILFSTFEFEGRYLTLDFDVVLNFEYEYIIIIIFSIFIIFFLDYLNKLYLRKSDQEKQKNVQLIIETRLGTYSPK